MRVVWRLLFGFAAVVLVVLLLAGGTRLRSLPPALRLATGVIFVFAVVRVSLGVALLALGDSWPVFLIPAALGVLAWRFRP